MECDWESLMLCPNKGNEASGGGTGNNGSLYSSSSSGDVSAKPEPDHFKVKAESMESGYSENKNVGFVDFRSQVQPDHESQNIKPSKLRLNSSKPELGAEGKEKETDQMGPPNSTVARTASDSEIGLRLGKRTYFEDASAIKTMASGSGAGAVKKRGVCQSMLSPRCQVEGCNTDLSSCKDYHKRHKVCEIHSKTAKVIVNGQDQRFCQQCSRFHVLSEFDDGKRSCRKRLVGHNQRRRKPQPDAMALNSTGLDSSFYDGSPTGFLMDRSSFMYPRIFSSSVLDGHNEFKHGHSRGTWPNIVKMENHLGFDGHIQMPAVNRQSYLNGLSRQQADRQLMFLQSNKAVTSNLLSQGINNNVQNPVNAVGKALTLTSSATGVLGGLEMDSATEILPGVSDSGRALSLLSPNSWGSRAPGSAAFDLFTRPGFTLEQFMHGNHSSVNHIPVQGMQQSLGLVSDKFLNIISQSSTGLVSDGYTSSAMSTMEKAHQQGPLVNTIGVIGNFESPMHCFLQTPELRSSQDSRSKDRCTIDLMRRSSQELRNESQEQSGLIQHGNGQYMEFQLMRSYEPPVFDSQHM